MKSFLTAYILVSILLSSACSDLIEYSPFDADVGSRLINRAQISGIPSAVNDTLRFAVFSDVHEGYDEMYDALMDINLREEISFVICNGDVTNGGLAREFEWYARILEFSEKPIVTVIGNHDCLANGPLIFSRLFGPADTSFVTGIYKFILFNNIIWENNNISPDYEWLRDQLKGNYKNIIVSHMPPITRDIGALHRIIYNSIADSTNTSFAIHSSAHRFSEYNYNGIHSVITTTVKDREYCLVEAYGDQFRVKRIHF